MLQKIVDKIGLLTQFLLKEEDHGNFFSFVQGNIRKIP
jgi:hypothetical protein